MPTFCRKYSLSIFFILTFLITWGLCGFLIVTAAPDAMQNIGPGFIVTAIISGLAPSVAAVLLSLLRGEAACLFGQIKAGRYWRFFIITATIVPVVTFISYLLCQPFNVHVRRSDLILGLIWPLFSSLGEEFGWRGFALPKLLERKGFLYSTTCIGLLWGMWHLPMDYIGLRSHGWLFIPEFLLIGPGILTAHSIIMAFIYIRSNRNLLLMITYHYTITASAIILPGMFTQNTSTGLSVLLQPLYANGILWIPAVFILFCNRQLTLKYRDTDNVQLSHNSVI